MQKKILAAAVLAGLMAPAAAFAEGYGIIEHHAEGVAMGGAAMFIENDAGNMAYNPAGITLCEGEQVKASATYISPHGWAKGVSLADVLAGNTKGSNWGKNVVHPAWAPGTYYVRKVGEKEWYGLGCYSRFGNMSEFPAGGWAATNNRFAKMNGLSITPTYARQSGRKFFWAVGADINYVGLELQKDYTAIPGTSGAMGTNKTEGDTWALGWNMGLRYAPTAKDEVGFAYHSKIAHTMDADFDAYALVLMDNPPGYSSPYFHTKAHGKVTLPDSYHFGYSHKFDDKNRVEIGAIRTQWHNFKSLLMNFDKPYLKGATQALSIHNWQDTWRYAIGYEHKFSKKYTGMIGFAFDESGIPYDGGQFMVPIGVRRTYSIGGKYTDKRHTIALTLGWQVEGDHSFKGYTPASSGTDGYVSATSYDNIAKIFSIGYTYHF